MEGIQESHAQKGEAHAKRAEGLVPSHRKVAAALSAAVTITKQQGNAPTPQAEPSMQKKHPTPNASRSSGEGVWGRWRFSQRSGLSPRVSPIHSLFGREREGGGFSAEKPPPSHISFSA